MMGTAIGPTPAPADAMLNAPFVSQRQLTWILLKQSANSG